MNAPQAPSLTRNTLFSGNGAALVLVVAWGTNFPLIEQLLGHWDIFSATLSRQVIGAAFLVTLLWMRTRRFPIHRALPWGRMIILGFTGPFCSSLLTTLAVFSAGSVAVAIVYAMAPLIAAVVARVFFAMPPARGIVIGITLAVAGGLIVKVQELQNASVTGGEGFMILALVTWTWHSIAAQRWLKGFSQTEIAAYTILPGSILLTVVVCIVWASGLATLHAPLNETTVTLAIAIGVIPIALGNLMWHFGVSRLGVTPMALWGNLVPVAAIALSAWFGAIPQSAQVIGGLIILAGVFYAQIASFRQSSRTAS